MSEIKPGKAHLRAGESGSPSTSEGFFLSVGFSKQPRLDNFPVGLRLFQPEDASALFAAIQESLIDLCAFMTWCRMDCSIGDSQSFIAQCKVGWEKGEQYTFAIFDPDDDTLLGSIGLNHVNQAHRFANVGYWVRRSRTRRGVATAAARLIAGFGLHELGLQRLEFLIPSNNLASQRVAYKIGAKFEGVLRTRLLLCVKPHDAVLYSLVAADLKTEASRDARFTVEN